MNCCAAFETKTNDYQIVFEDGWWSVNGCCGGGCYVLSDILFCPFCGTKLKSPCATLDMEPVLPKLV